MGRRNWNREELILAINLYFKTPFGRIHNRNPEIKHLASIIGRTPSSVSWKLVNFASLDPSLKARGIKGAQNISKLDKKIWNEFYNNIEELSYESELLLAEKEEVKVEDKVSYYDVKEGRSDTRTVKVRINQSFFRSSILASYNYKCCITGIAIKDLLIASHIKPWRLDKINRLNPTNGLCLNALHDRAFDRGYITILPSYTIKVSDVIRSSNDKSLAQYFNNFNNKKIVLPHRFLPDVEFLKFHNDEIFKS